MQDDDLTSKARLRHAAFQLFAEKGVKATSTRDIANAAGVSIGLIRHHYGSKEGLRQACDDWIANGLIQTKLDVLAGRQNLSGQLFAAMSADAILAQKYLGRSLLEGSTTVQALMDTMVARTEEWLDANHKPGMIVDRRAYATLLVLNALATSLLSDEASRLLGADVMSGPGRRRLMEATLELYTVHPIPSDTATTMRSWLATYGELFDSPESDRGDTTDEPTDPTRH